MKAYIEPIGKLINSLTKLPGVGTKTAERFAYRIISMDDCEVEQFAKSILAVKRDVHYCKICGNFTENEVCGVCANRKNDVICVVKEPKNVSAIEKAGEFNGVYHVLHGTLNPMEGIGPNEIKIRELLFRLNEGQTSEVIIATNPDVEGEATAMYISKLIKPLGVKVTRLAHGIAVGTDLEYADISSLARAIADRREI